MGFRVQNDHRLPMPPTIWTQPVNLSTRTASASLFEERTHRVGNLERVFLGSLEDNQQRGAFTIDCGLKRILGEAVLDPGDAIERYQFPAGLGQNHDFREFRSTVLPAKCADTDLFPLCPDGPATHVQIASSDGRRDVAEREIVFTQTGFRDLDADLIVADSGYLHL